MSPRKRTEKNATDRAAGAQVESSQSEPPAREISSVDEIVGVSAAVEGDAEILAPSGEGGGDAAAARPSVAPPVGPPETREHMKRVIESLVFASEQIITAQQLARLVKSKVADIRELMPELIGEWVGRGIELVEVANGYQFRSAATSAPYVRDLVAQRPVRLTRAQLETLALVAYRQPITRPEIDDVRGVDSGSALKVLLERGLLKILGRKDEPGRPLLYGSTPYFLEFFGMKSMSDLPTLREFTDLTEEHRVLFQRKTGEIPEDLGNEVVNVVHTEETFDDDELMAIAEAAKAEAEDREAPQSETLPPADQAESAD